jgi:pimeloyl-ACP methyl ester carboxylesterase
VLLLHGQPGSSRDWDGVVAHLSPSARARVIVPDRPGWGGARSPTGLAGNAAAAVAAIDAAGADRVTVVGHSLGGAVAASLAVGHPERVGALVLLAPAANEAALDAFDRLLAAPVIGPLASAALLLSPGLVLATPRVRRRIAAAFELDEDYLRAATRTLLTAAGWRSFVFEQRALVHEVPELERRLGEIAVTTMIVFGADDRVVRPASGVKLASQIAGAELVVLDHAGHLLPQREPERLAKLIERATEGRRSADRPA